RCIFEFFVPSGISVATDNTFGSCVAKRFATNNFVLVIVLAFPHIRPNAHNPLTYDLVRLAIFISSCLTCKKERRNKRHTQRPFGDHTFPYSDGDLNYLLYVSRRNRLCIPDLSK